MSVDHLRIVGILDLDPTVCEAIRRPFEFRNDAFQVAPTHFAKEVGAASQLNPQEHRWLMMRAAHFGLRPSEYLRWLVLADLQQKIEDRLLQTVEAEHMRLTLLAAQQGKPLTPELLKKLRGKAILSAPIIKERTMRLVQQQLRPVSTEQFSNGEPEEEA